jgi:A/G-specific adenine glycosylase
LQSSISELQGQLDAQQFAERVIHWQQLNGRHDLPWQREANPYHVLVSELMLQQTQVSTVIPYFERWLQRFPTVEHLAQAHIDEVMAMWQGLGYYSRARNLHRAAQQICSDYAGTIPQGADELREIAGIGAYTAGAIQAFAYDRDGVIVDGNVKRLFSRFFAIDGDLTSSAKQRLLWQLAEHFTPSSNNRRYAQGLLDLGATICTPRQPQCHNCPLSSDCLARQQDRVAELPERKKKAAVPSRNGYFLWHASADGIVLEQRPSEGIWPSLWCLPEMNQVTAMTLADTATVHGSFKHTFSHYKLAAQIFTCDQQQAARAATTSKRPQRQIGWFELEHIGLPAPIAKYLQQHLPKPPPST